MVYDAVSRHSAGKLSMEAFKSEIFRRQPDLAGEAPAAEPAAPGRVAFHETLPTLRQIEDALVAEALRRAGGNQAIAATMLGITRQALNKRLNKPAAERVTPAPMTNGTGRLTIEEIFLPHYGRQDAFHLVATTPQKEGYRMALEKGLDKISGLVPSKHVFSFLDEFKNFALKGNVIDLAVGVIIGAAFGRSWNRW